MIVVIFSELSYALYRYTAQMMNYTKRACSSSSYVEEGLRNFMLAGQVRTSDQHCLTFLQVIGHHIFVNLYHILKYLRSHLIVIRKMKNTTSQPIT